MVLVQISRRSTDSIILKKAISMIEIAHDPEIHGHCQHIFFYM